MSDVSDSALLWSATSTGLCYLCSASNIVFNITRYCVQVWEDTVGQQLQRRAHIVWEEHAPRRVFIVKKSSSLATSQKLKEIAVWCAHPPCQQSICIIIHYYCALLNSGDRFYP